MSATMLAMKKPAITSKERACIKYRSGFTIFNSIRMRLVGLAFGIAACGSTNAQSGCWTNAVDKYDLGKFNEAAQILTTCLAGATSNDEKFPTHKLLVKTYIANDYYDSARKYIREILRYRPYYSPDPAEESLTFIERFTEERRIFEREHLTDVTVTTATKREQRSSDAPTTIYVRTREQIQTRGYRNLVDLLEDISEVEIQKNSISEFRNVVSIRGIAGNEKFIIMLDGICITPATGDPYTLGTNYSLVDAKKVEVILGPSSALYGVDAFSGIINIITMNDEDVKRSIINTSLGSYATGDYSAIFTTHPASGVSFTVAGQYYHSQEPDFYNLYKKEFDWYNQQYLPEGLMDFNGVPKPINSSVSERKFEMPTFSYFISSKLNIGNFEIGTSRNMEQHSSSISVDHSIPGRHLFHTRFIRSMPNIQPKT
jgi:hypothetical protein